MTGVDIEMIAGKLINTVLCMDALELLKQLPDKSVDLIVTDPDYELSHTPAGKSIKIHQRRKHTEVAKNNSKGFDIETVFAEFQRVLKKFNLFCFCSNSQISRIMTWGESRGFYTTLLGWEKEDCTPFANNVWRQDFEPCIHIMESGATFHGGATIKRKIWRGNTLKGTIHPCQKPIDIILKYIQIGSNPEDLILDCFAGSFTVAKSCQELNRRWICCEKEERNCEIGRQRLAEVPLITI